MDDDEPPSNVVDFTKKKAAAPLRLTSAMILDGLALTRVFLTIRSAAERKRILRLAREAADSDENKKA
jgi:hypothetical protein